MPNAINNAAGYDGSGPRSQAPDLAWIKRRVDALKGARQPHEQHWRESFDYSLPLRGYGLNGDTWTGADGAAQKRAQLLHGAATDGVQTLASAICGGTVPASARWAEGEVDGADDEGKAWLDEQSTQLHQDIHATNFDSVNYEATLDLVVAGWFPMYVDVNDDDGEFIFEEWPLAECYIGASRLGGAVDTIAREFQQTAEQCVTYYGDKVSAATAKLAHDKPDQMVRMIRLVCPRPGGKEGAKLSRNLPFASYTLEADCKTIVREKGYHEFPVVVPRWALLPGTCYAVGRMFDALPDARELNALMVMEKQAAGLNILPPMKAKDDGVLNVGSIKKLQSGKLYAVAEMDNIEPIITGAKFEMAITSEERLMSQIRRTLLADQLSPPDGPVKSATEIHVRVALLRQMLGPIYGRMQAEYLSGLFTRCFMLKYRRGAMGQAPQSIANKNMRVRFVSPLARAQRLEDVSAMDRYEQTIGAAAQVGHPEVGDNYDWDEAYRMRPELLGVPRKLIRDKRSRDKLRKAQADQAAQAQQAEMAANTQQTMIDAAGKRMANEGA